jgi:hypothetical protein
MSFTLNSPEAVDNLDKNVNAEVLGRLLQQSQRVAALRRRRRRHRRTLHRRPPTVSHTRHRPLVVSPLAPMTIVVDGEGGHGKRILVSSQADKVLIVIALLLLLSGGSPLCLRVQVNGAGSRYQERAGARVQVAHNLLKDDRLHHRLDVNDKGTRGGGRSLGVFDLFAERLGAGGEDETVERVAPAAHAANDVVEVVVGADLVQQHAQVSGQAGRADFGDFGERLYRRHLQHAETPPWGRKLNSSLGHLI